MIWKLIKSIKSTQSNAKFSYKKGLVKVQVIHVHDGDTIRVRMRGGKEERVRFLLVDTPELSHPKKGKQPFGEEARLYARYKIYTSQVVELGFDQEERDHYGRMLAYVYCDRQLLQEELVRRGLARVYYTRNRNETIVNRVREAQNEAKKNRRGIWSCEGYVSRNGYDPQALGLLKRLFYTYRGKLLRSVFG
ncbi:thermonuclease family protein [Thermoflavimicrobium daqui]|jgi:endonuclease YncB( thermonuclease family)|uniref:TNase-like domain-containing protein n=1 Tax=Thermoflavimicrobium daqui TaxID=2137476 RepID=A0A364K0Q7_9BACL|nr:thermonuclease family protein [Thermoflavimicrobium daqui]RAL20848.1 hypothetical protein DL897_17600 [Thermoflavimicrobium daqui]